MRVRYSPHAGYVLVVKLLLCCLQDFREEEPAPVLFGIDFPCHAIIHHVDECNVRHRMSSLLGEFEHMLDYSDVVCHDGTLHLRICVARLLRVLKDV